MNPRRCMKILRAIGYGLAGSIELAWLTIRGLAQIAWGLCWLLCIGCYELGKRRWGGEA